MSSPLSSFQSPQTPPKRRERFSARFSSFDDVPAGISPGSSPKSASDSGVEDVFDSPFKTKAKQINGDSPVRVKPAFEVDNGSHEGSEHHASSDASHTPTDEDGSAKKMMPDDPFASEHSRILFEAIDELQTYGSGEFLDIPQLIIVGGQSTGKSSLLQSLTEIPFPVGTGCCTRFPTRIVSRRTAPGKPDSFRITIEKASQRLAGMQAATGKFERYKEGEALSTEEFVKVVDEISTKHMGIRRGQGPDKKNFAADVLKIELSGPNRSYFSILDLPGIFHNASEVNESDIAGVKRMIVEYMKRPENIVICVADALTDLDNHEILKMASDHVDEQRRVGVLTKCDMIKPESSQARKVVSDARGKTMPGGWFLVRNRTEDDSKSIDVQDAEDSLFSEAPWTSLPRNRLGSTALKTHLGSLLSAKIRSSFPSIQADIRNKLFTSLTERDGLGEPRNSHLARQQYLISLVRRYEEKAKFALERPGLLGVPAMELRREVRRLNDDFDQFMRQKGAFWEFEESNADPGTLLQQLSAEPKAEENQKSPSKVKKAGPKPTTAFSNWSHTEHSEHMRRTIEQALEDFKGAQLPGVVNPDIYPIIYRKQVEKWPQITKIHLERVKLAVKNCFEALLKSICPPTDGTAELHQRLLNTLNAKFKESFEDLESLCNSECRRETECTMPLTSDPRFEEELYNWRRLRLWRGVLKIGASGKGINLENIDFYYRCMHLTVQENMTNDVHDVVKVYYKLSLETFIRDITNKYVEDFVSDSTGPIRGLNTDYIMGLSEEEVEKLASENEATVKRRRELDQEILKLDRANTIAERASERTADLDSA